MDTGCLLSSESSPGMHLKGSDRPNSETESKNLFDKERRGKKDWLRIETSKQIPLKPSGSHLLSGFRTVPNLKTMDRVSVGELASSPVGVFSPWTPGDVLGEAQEERMGGRETKAMKVPCYPPVATLSSGTVREQGLLVYKPVYFPSGSASELSTPQTEYFDETKGTFLHNPWSSTTGAPMEPMEPMVPSTFHSKPKYFFSSTKTKNPHLYTPTLDTSAHLPSWHDWASLPGSPIMGTSYPTSPHLVSPSFFQNNTKKNRYGHPWTPITSSTSWDSFSYKEGVPCRQPRAPPPMDVLLSTNNSENKNFSLRLRKQAINKLVYAGTLRQNNLSSTQTLKTLPALE